MDRCVDCGASLGLVDKWGKYQRCHECHFKHEPGIPERVRARIAAAARAIDAHAENNHGLEPGTECRECLTTAWTAFCEAREIMGMGDTWTQYQRYSHTLEKR